MDAVERVVTDARVRTLIADLKSDAHILERDGRDSFAARIKEAVELLSLARSNGWQDKAEIVRICESVQGYKGLEHEQIANTILDRLRGSEGEGEKS